MALKTFVAGVQMVVQATDEKEARQIIVDAIAAPMAQGKASLTYEIEFIEADEVWDDFE